MKTCSKCGETKPQSCFYKNRPECKNCTKRPTHKDRDPNIKRNLQMVNLIKVDSGCLVCGYNNVASAIEFHHVHEKYRNITDMVQGANKIERILDEMSKCLILCANCHRELHEVLK
jgi:hypothetical protein